MMFNENGLGDHRTDAGRPTNSEKRNDDMDEKNDKIAHLGFLTRTANTINCGAKWQFATLCLMNGRRFRLR